MIPEIALRVLYRVGGRKERSGSAKGLVNKKRNIASDTSGMNESAPAPDQLKRRFGHDTYRRQYRCP